MLEVYYMYKAYKFRLYPDSSQKQMLSKTFGCVRLIYNYFLDFYNLLYQLIQVLAI